MNIDPVHLAFRSTAEGAQKILSELGVELTEANARRDKILLDIRKASAAADAGDQRARFELAVLNKLDAAAGRLILSLEARVADARKRLGMAETQAATVEAKRAESDAAPVSRDKLFEVICPDGARKVRHRHHSLEALRKALQPGYSIAGEVFGANADDTGGFVSTPGAPSMLKALLESQGSELLEFLEAHGIVGSDKQAVVVLPSNNRESMQ